MHTKKLHYIVHQHDILSRPWTYREKEIGSECLRLGTIVTKVTRVYQQISLFQQINFENGI
jgi:hypothetical protein